MLADKIISVSITAFLLYREDEGVVHFVHKSKKVLDKMLPQNP